MSTDASHPGRRELRVTVTDKVYEQLQALAADSRVPAEEYAARMLTGDVTHARLLAGAEQFVAEHALGFAEHFGPHPGHRHHREYWPPGPALVVTVLAGVIPYMPGRDRDLGEQRGCVLPGWIPDQSYLYRR